MQLIFLHYRFICWFLSLNNQWVDCPDWLFSKKKLSSGYFVFKWLIDDTDVIQSINQMIHWLIWHWLAKSVQQLINSNLHQIIYSQQVDLYDMLYWGLIYCDFSFYYLCWPHLFLLFVTVVNMWI